MSTTARSGASAATAQKRLRVADRRHDLLAGVAEEPDESLAEEDLVLGDHYAHGSSAAIVVPPPGGLITRNRPP